MKTFYIKKKVEAESFKDALEKESVGGAEIVEVTAEEKENTTGNAGFNA